MNEERTVAVVLIAHPRNGGVGAAVVTGYHARSPTGST